LIVRTIISLSFAFEAELPSFGSDELPSFGSDKLIRCSDIALNTTHTTDSISMVVTVNLRVGTATLMQQHSRPTPQNTPIQPVTATTNPIGGCDVI
jgi:hypothetical protein